MPSSMTPDTVAEEKASCLVFSREDLATVGASFPAAISQMHRNVFAKLRATGGVNAASVADTIKALTENTVERTSEVTMIFERPKQ